MLSEHSNRLPTTDTRRANTPQGDTLVARFETQAAATPHAIAATFGDDHLTYAQLNAQANRLAHRLIADGAVPDRLVALLLRPGLDLLAAMLATLKAGAGYLPLDPRDPPPRLAAMLEDARPVALLHASEDALPTTDGIAVHTLDLPDFAAALAKSPTADPTDADRATPLGPGHTAYVIYTSGSTGRPKGVVITHRNVVRLFDATDRWFGFGPDDVWTLFHSFCFDFSVWEIWGALLHGGRLVIVPYETVRSPRDFLDLLAKEGVTVLNQTPSAFYGLMRADADRPDLGRRLALRTVIFGGEALDFRRLVPWYDRHADDRPRLVNMYGITETTVHVSYLPLTRALAAASSDSLIGEPIPDLRIHVLDEAMQPVAPDTIGEMFIEGAGLARGYLNRPELTAERFVRSPSGGAAARLYRTGDLARRRADGMLAYCGRSDQQVKVRGHRIETGEVAAALAGLDGVADAAVVARVDAAGNNELAGYVVMRAGALFDAAGLRRALAARLPAHMIPASLVALPAIPLTRNGKLDRAALPEPGHDDTVASGSAPADATERAVAAIWRRVLRRDHVARDVNFFDAGGNSLLMWDVHEALRRELGIDLPISVMFAHATVASLARALAPEARRPADPRPAAEARQRALLQADAMRRIAALRSSGAAR